MTAPEVRAERRGWRELTPLPPDGEAVEVTVVMPCLNEAETLGQCIQQAQAALHGAGIAGEVVVADNGSTDGSPEIAARLGARVIAVAQRGYGAALIGGINAARGQFVLMGDADASYDFGELPKFVARLREGCDVVQGCRLPSGGGRIEPGAMRFLHRILGNPLFSFLGRWWFRVPIHDIHCGLRAFRRDFWLRLGQRCTGMEFASEMLIRAALKSARIGEVPITLHPDGRTAHRSHLRTFRDGWRHLRFYLLFSPRWLFLVPGAILMLLGLIGYGLGFPRMSLGRATFDVNTLLFASLGIILGYQSIVFAFMTRVFGTVEGFMPEDPRLTKLYQVLNLERGLVLGLLATLAGFGFLAAAVAIWVEADFGQLDYARVMRIVIPGVTLAALGVQTVLSSFFFSILGLARR
ncbi:MAG: glycosyltransferase family 2 protein [Gemmatimonadales bacterium]